MSLKRDQLIRSNKTLGESILSELMELLLPADLDSRGQKYNFYGNNRVIFDCQEQEVMLSGPADCLAGETLLYDHSIGRNIPIGSIKHSPELSTIRGVQYAEQPFRKDKKRLYRVSIKDNRSFLASENHLILTDKGWKFISDVSVYDNLLIYGGDHPQSRLGFSRLVQLSNDQNFVQKFQDYCQRYFSCSHQYDALPQMEEENGLIFSPLLNGVFEHNHVYHSKDGLCKKQEYNHLYLLLHLLSISGYFDHAGHTSDKEYHSLLDNLLHAFYSFLLDEQSQIRISFHLPILELILDFSHRHSFLALLYNSFYHKKVQRITVSNIKYERTDYVYDLTVPGIHHYIDTQGFIHHNTGKTLAALSYLNQLCWKYPKAQMAIIRKTAASMPGSVLQSFQNKIVNKDTDGIEFYGGDKHPSMYIYPNGSIIWVGGLDKASKVLSSERDVIYVNQAEELLLPEWETLITRANGRAGNLPFSMVYGDCNPSAPTHWIKTRAKAGQLKFLEVTHRDNPDIYDPVTGELTESGARRIKALSGLTGATRLRLFQGIWAQPEGAIYDIFDEEKHKVKPFPIPAHWPRIVGIDPFGAYICALWLAYDPDNNMLVVYREYYEPFGVTTPEHAKNILALSGYDQSGRPTSSAAAEPIFIWIGGGPSERQARTDWAAAGIPLQANQIVEVWSQIDKVYQLLKDFKLVVFDTCANLLSEIGSYKRKIVNGVVTDAIENDEQFHALSALRYSISYISTPNNISEPVYDPVRIGRYFQEY